MEDKLFDTKEKAESAVANFKSLLEHPGWKLYAEVLKANIAVVTDAILQGTGDKEKDDRLRDKRVVYTEDLNTPTDLIKKLTPSVSGGSEEDPYETVEQTAERRKKT